MSCCVGLSFCVVRCWYGDWLGCAALLLCGAVVAVVVAMLLSA
jgi:hypothetical protein